MTSDPDVYRRRYDSFLKRVASNLEDHVAGHITGTPDIDHVRARAKDPGRFAEKSGRVDEHGQAKYQKPLTEIQDQLGARIVVFYKPTVHIAAEVVHKYFQPIEERELVPESDWEFGYFGQHFVLALPGDVIPPDVDVKGVPRFFELQIKTLFQHAWSEANHELGYKSHVQLTSDQRRRLAFTAAQAWGADRIFEELSGELLKT